MPKKRFSAEQIVRLLRQIEVLMAQGKSAPEACRDAVQPLSTDVTTVIDPRSSTQTSPSTHPSSRLTYLPSGEAANATLRSCS